MLSRCVQEKVYLNVYQHLGDQLTEDKRVQLGELIDWYEQRVLRGATGNNSLVEHSTELTSDEPT